MLDHWARHGPRYFLILTSGVAAPPDVRLAHAVPEHDVERHSYTDDETTSPHLARRDLRQVPPREPHGFNRGGHGDRLRRVRLEAGARRLQEGEVFQEAA